MVFAFRLMAHGRELALKAFAQTQGQLSLVLTGDPYTYWVFLNLLPNVLDLPLYEKHSLSLGYLKQGLMES